MFDNLYLDCLAIVTLTCVLTGCGKSGSDTPVVSDPKVLFEMHCAKCHAQAGQPGGPPGVGSSKGPDLSHIGKRHNAEWITKYVRDPKSQDPNSNMPALGDKMREEELQKLTDYLASQK